MDCNIRTSLKSRDEGQSSVWQVREVNVAVVDTSPITRLFRQTMTRPTFLFVKRVRFSRKATCCRECKPFSIPYLRKAFFSILVPDLREPWIKTSSLICFILLYNCERRTAAEKQQEQARQAKMQTAHQPYWQDEQGNLSPAWQTATRDVITHLTQFLCSAIFMSVENAR